MLRAEGLSLTGRSAHKALILNAFRREASVPQERTEAVVLRGVNFSESSRIVTFLTPDRGRLVCMAAGARRSKSGLSAVLDTFNRLEIVYYWKESRSVQKLGEASLLDGYAALKADLERATYAALPLEIALKAAQENEPSHELYGALVDGLERLGRWRGNVRVFAAWQMVRLLEVAGLAPNLESGGRPVGFANSHGVVDASQRSDYPLTDQEYQALCTLAASRDACPALENIGSVFRMLCTFATCHFESRFRSVRVIEQMFG